MATSSKPIVVMELGAERCQLGFSNETTPRASMRTLLGRPKRKVSVELRDHYVGEEAELKSSLLHVRHPLRHGMVNSWDDMVLLWRHAFRDLLRVPSEEHPVLVTEPPLLPPVNREKMTQVLFETFSVPAMYVALQQLLTLLSLGHVDGVVLDSGYDATYVVPVCDGFAIKSGVERIEVGGRDLTRYMSRLLNERGLGAAVTQPERTSRIKENLCYVAADVESEMLKLDQVEASYQLPDGQVIRIAEERFRVPEALFQPSLLGSESGGVHRVLASSIERCTPEMQKRLDTVVVAGGSTRFPGFADRLSTEMTKLRFTHLKLRDDSVSPAPSAWLGGAILAQLPTFQSMWITRQEYEEEGPSVVHRKCDHL